MALLDRLKERIETDLTDLELQAILDEISADIVQRFGPEGAITIHLGGDRDVKGDRKFHTLIRPLDNSLAVTVVEIEPASASGAANETTLDATDFRVLDRGRTIERLTSGSNGRSFWAAVVKITYTPVSMQRQRDEVSIQVAKLLIEARGLQSERAGDWQATYLDLAPEHNKLLDTLNPRRGLVMA